MEERLKPSRENTSNPVAPFLGSEAQVNIKWWLHGIPLGPASPTDFFRDNLMYLASPISWSLLFNIDFTFKTLYISYSGFFCRMYPASH